MRNKTGFFFLVPALLFAGLLVYAVANALAIYIPQERERRSFQELKKTIQVTEQATGPEEASSAGGRAAASDASLASADSDNPFLALQQRNADFVGWLTIDDSRIDYPVMKSSEETPEYYLHRDFDGNDSFSGCLFIGGGCDADSRAFVIYGHKMNNDSMFGTLDSYADYDFAREHSEIRFSTSDGDRVYKVFAAFQTKIYQDRDDVFKYYESVGDISEEEYQQTVESVRSLSSLHVADAPEYPAQLLFLSTCSYHTEDGRFVVAAYEKR